MSTISVRDAGVIVAITYVCIQVIITILTSIISLLTVKEANAKTKFPHQADEQLANVINADNKTEQLPTQQTNNVSITVNNTNKLDEESSENSKAKQLSKQKLFTIWLKTMWKMRSIYSAFTVHIFDVMTDILVISEWYDKEKNMEKDIDHIDTRQLAIVALSILFLHKIISSVAIFIATNGSIIRAILQFCDLLLFEEILIAHRKIVKYLTNYMHISNDDNTATDKYKKFEKLEIESTMRFKYIRSLEALFESTPQAILQIVYMMRTSEFVGNWLIIISTVQSILSMASSMINADNAYMSTLKFKIYKKKFPPSFKFVQHGLIRLTEISYRILLLSLFWTVMSGPALFGLVMIELCLIIDFLRFEFRQKKRNGGRTFSGILLDSNTILLFLNQVELLGVHVCGCVLTFLGCVFQ